jgi:pimeloyl-ACP methyl ester carboxylesterase
MATFLLVHGGNMSTDIWNRLRSRDDFPPGGLLGAKYWNGTRAYLESHGHRVLASDLPDEHLHDLSDHIRGIRSKIERLDLRQIVLVGHSYGGMVITGIAAQVPGRIRRMVYVDAALPDPGESLFDQFALGKVDPLSVTGLEPASAYVERLQFDPVRIRRIPKTYVLCTKSDFAMVTGIARKKVAEQVNAQWMYVELPTSHVPMATMPGRFNRLMLEMAYR